MRVALDLMGGDFAPLQISDGLKLFLDEDPKTEFLLTGPQEVLESELKRIGYFGDSRLKLVHAPDVVTMEDSPRDSYKSKKDSSIRLAVMALREKEADAFVTMGNTGAAVFACQLVLGCLEGVKRPGLAVPFPTVNKTPCLLMDMGASVLPKVEHLVGYGVMAYCYAKTVFQIPNPRVGLMNVGEEVAKGNDLAKEAHHSLSKLNINFQGNAEGDDIFKGEFDVIVCDGFTGNVLLKSCEQLAKWVLTTIKTEIQTSWFRKLAALAIKPVFANLKKKTDPSEFGGAILLGVKGICLIGHGKANARTVYNAIHMVKRACSGNLNELIVREMKAVEENVSSQPIGEK